MYCFRKFEDYPVQEDFDIKSYTGNWLELYRTKSSIFETGTDIETNFELNVDGTIDIVEKEYNPTDHKWETFTNKGTIPDLTRPAHMKVKYKWYLPKCNYCVLYTDYRRIAVIYSYFSLLGCCQRHNVWILGRKRSISQSHIERAFDEIKTRLGIDKSAFHLSPISEMTSVQ